MSTTRPLRPWGRSVTDQGSPSTDVRDEEIARLKHAISGLIPWVASSGRGKAQEALAEACELIGADPFMWSGHPDVLIQRRPDLERRRNERP